MKRLSVDWKQYLKLKRMSWTTKHFVECFIVEKMTAALKQIKQETQLS